MSFVALFSLPFLVIISIKVRDRNTFKGKDLRMKIAFNFKHESFSNASNNGKVGI